MRSGIAWTEYKLNGKFHRIDGPAYINWNNKKSYYLHGKEVSKKQHDFYVDLLKLKNIEEK